MRSANPEAASFTLSFYEALPSVQLRYEEFKKHASDRFQILQKLDRKVAVRHTDILLKQDLLEHACLQLVCCQSVSMSIFFVNNETMLFRHRIDANPEAALLFFQDRIWPHLNLGLPVTEKESTDSSSTEDTKHTSIIITEHSFYDPSYINTIKYLPRGKIHFTKCSDLLTRREHRIKKGYFDLGPIGVIKSFLINEFKRVIAKRIEALGKLVSQVREERFLRLGRELFTKGTSDTKTVPDALSKEERFPLCIKGVIQRLKTTGHLKYMDRQTLCLFFKDIGMPLEKTVEYFRTYFRCSFDQFNKDYLYSIRHNYGLEGRRASYGSFTCNKLIGLANDPNAFGCPFVRNKGFVKEYVDIEDMGRDIFGSCGKAGTVITGSPLPAVFTNPADYFRLLEKSVVSANPI